LHSSKLLAKFGIYHKNHLLVVVSNRAHEIGDIALAMSSLRDRIAPGAQPRTANAAGSSQELEPEPEAQDSGSATETGVEPEPEDCSAMQ
jgi:hypothetical protein